MTLIRNKEEIRCMECKGELNAIPHSTSGESRFRFAMTHRRDGTPIKNLHSHGPFLGTIEAARCVSCGHEQAVMDSLEDREEWSRLPNWHKEN